MKFWSPNPSLFIQIKKEKNFLYLFYWNKSQREAIALLTLDVWPFHKFRGCLVLFYQFHHSQKERKGLWIGIGESPEAWCVKVKSGDGRDVEKGEGKWRDKGNRTSLPSQYPPSPSTFILFDSLESLEMSPYSCPVLYSEQVCGMPHPPFSLLSFFFYQFYRRYS